MYQRSQGAARRLGPCLRTYQAHPQVRTEGKREGAGRDPPQSRRVGRSARSVRAGAVASYRPFSPVQGGAWRGEGSRGTEDRAAGRGVHGMLVLPGLGRAGGVEAGMAGRGRISPAFPRLPVPGGDLKDKGRRGSQPGRGAAPEFPGPDQTDPRAALCSPRILHRDSGPGRKAGLGGPGSGPCARPDKMATPPAETAPRGSRYPHGPPGFAEVRPAPPGVP